MQKNQDTNEEDIEFVPEDGEDLKVADPIQKIKDLKDKLKISQEERQDYLSNWQKERADFLNFKKEETERAKTMRAYIEENIISDLLPVLDSYDMAFANKEAWEKVDKNWRMGVEYIHQQILKILGEHGVSVIGTETGDLFNPAFHQSIETIDTDEKNQDHTIASITQSGYKMGDKVLRPARVNVFGYKEN